MYCATPYDIHLPWFYFETFADYQTGETGSLAEEFELQFIDGSTLDCRLFHALKVNQATLEHWFDVVEPMGDSDKLQLLVLLDNGYTPADALEKYEDVTVFEGTPTDYAHDFVESTGMLDGVCKTVASYFNYEALGRDIVMNGDAWTTTIDGTNYVVRI